jgi:hypothetical protein
LGVDGGAAAGCSGAGFGYSGGYRGGRLGPFVGEEVVGFGAAHLYPEVEAVDQGA